MKKNRFKRAGALSTAAVMAAMSTGCAMDSSAPATTAAPAPSTVAETTQAAAPSQPDVESEKPNIVYIVIDDMGYADLGCYGSSISTPSIDALVEDGIMYSDYYTQPMSSPSRAAILTGCESNQVGMGIISDVDFGETVPNVHGRVYEEFGTIADNLAADGYETMAVGKWHLGPFPEFTADGDRRHWPSGFGFTKNYCFVGSQANQFKPGSLMVGDEFQEADFSEKDYHFTKDMVDTSLQYIDEAGDKPFFLYFATGALHGPLQAPQEYIDKYAGKFSEGYDVEREKILDRQVGMGLFAKGTELPERNKGVPAWDSLSADEKKVAEKHMEVYAAFLEHTDNQIGRMIESIKDSGEYDNTVFMLVSDNGSNSSGDSYGKSMSHINENVMNDPISHQVEVLDEFGGPVYGPQYNKGWAMASATPFRYNKTYAYNGGIRVPLIVTYKNGIADPGRICNQMVDSSDLTPTVLELLDIDALTELNGIQLKPMGGISFLKNFTSAEPDTQRDKTLFYMLLNNYCYSDGGYIVVSDPVNGKVCLYDMEKDPTQIHDLSGEMPDKKEELLAAFEVRKKELNSQNLLVDFLTGVTPEVMAERYGETATEVLTALQTKTPPQGEEAKLWYSMIEAIMFDPGAGYTGVGVTLFDAPDSPHSKRDYTYDPKDGTFFSEAAAPIQNVSHSISTTVVAPDDAEGVIMARGGLEGGYTVYVKDKKLVYEYNFCNEAHRLVSDTDLPAGEVSIEYIYDKTGLFDGTGTLKMNGEVVAEGPMKNLPIFISFDDMSFGKDTGSLVSTEYQRDFEFNGELGLVNIHLGDDLWEINN